MIQKGKNHIGYYIALLVILSSGFSLAFFTSPNKQLQVIVVMITTFFYIAWGILHHLVNHDLTAKIVVEYILIGSFGLSAVFFLLKGGLF